MNKNLEIPILVFAYKRFNLLKKLISSLKKNKEHSKHKLYIFIDGPKNLRDTLKVKKVKNYCKTICGFKSIKIIERKKNFGLAKNIVNGITRIFKKYECAIILEDDLEVGKFFLDYMNKCLNKYKDFKKIWHISAWSNCPLWLSKFYFYDFYLSSHMNCWGWGTWNDRWKFYEKNPNKLLKSWPMDKIIKFDNHGLFNNWSQIIRNRKKIINTWAVFWNATIFHNKGLCLNPTNTLVINRGHDMQSTHMRLNDKFFQPNKLINKRLTNFNLIIKKNKLIDKLILLNLRIKKIFLKLKLKIIYYKEISQS